ncbi:MAG: NAD-dependent epimerase/dehydratase family protein [Solirubrobacterales bacterium]
MRYLITGGSGYIGSRVAEQLAAQKQTETVVVGDIRPPAFRPEKLTFRKLDVCDSAAVATALAEEEPDVLIHMAFVVDPTHDEPAMYETNVNGTFNVLAAAAAGGIGRAVVTTATMAYGPWRANPVPITENQPVHGHARYVYARHAAEADRIAQLWATLHRQRRMTIVRPCTVFGPGADNHLVRMWENQSFFPDFGTGDQPTQFLHIDDAVSGIVQLVESEHPGVFNLVPDGEITWHQCAQLAGLEVRGVREQSFTDLAGGMWRLKMPNVEIPPSFVDFFKYPYLASNDRIKQAIPGWQPQHTSRDTFAEMIQTARSGVGQV